MFRLPPKIAFALLAFASSASAQLVHKGPAAAVALSKTLRPYDVVSIKKNQTGAPYWHMNIGVDSYTATNIPLALLIGDAYDIKPDLIVGLSGAIDTARYDVEAKVVPQDGSAPKLTDPQLSAMLIPLLADRFRLKVHIEPKTISVYDLVVAKGGPKIKLVPLIGHDHGGWRISSRDANQVLTGTNVTVPYLADVLSDQTGRNVIDKTGLSGHADITLKWSDDVAMQQGGPDAISIFTALQDQLGLKLVPSKGPVDTLVIDHAEMPTPN